MMHGHGASNSPYSWEADDKAERAAAEPVEPRVEAEDASQQSTHRAQYRARVSQA